MVKAGVFLTYTASAAGLAYVAATWDEPNRGLIAAMFVGGILSAAVIQLLPVAAAAPRPFRRRLLPHLEHVA